MSREYFIVGYLTDGTTSLITTVHFDIGKTDEGIVLSFAIGQKDSKMFMKSDPFVKIVIYAEEPEIDLVLPKGDHDE